MGFARKWMFLPALLVAATFIARVAVADPLPNPNDGAVFLVISAPEPEFTLGNFDNEGPSSVVLIRVGRMVGGAELTDTRFIAENVPPHVLPEGTTLADLHGHQVTLIGGFQVPVGEEQTEPHIVTPTPPNPDALIAQQTQQLIFDALNSGAFDSLGNNPTTQDIVDAIVGSSEGVSDQDVFNAVFDSPMTLNFGGAGVAVTEGDQFPHTGGTSLMFSFLITMEENDDGDLEVTEVSGCKVVGIDVKPKKDPNVINFKKKKGKLRVAFLSGPGFDATEVLWETAHIGPVFAHKKKIRDVNGDGLDDMVLRFKMKSLIEQNIIRCDTQSLTMEAELEDGSCVIGVDGITVDDDCECENDDDDDDDED
jgi:hypothetical protein